MEDNMILTIGNKTITITGDFDITIKTKGIIPNQKITEQAKIMPCGITRDARRSAPKPQKFDRMMKLYLEKKISQQMFADEIGWPVTTLSHILTDMKKGIEIWDEDGNPINNRRGKPNKQIRKKNNRPIAGKDWSLEKKKKPEYWDNICDRYKRGEITQWQAAKLCNMSTSTFKNYLEGRRIFSEDM